MVDEIGRTAAESIRDIFDGPKAGKAENRRERAGGTADNNSTAAELDSRLDELLQRVRAADTVRKERVHQVSEKLARGELLSQQAIEGAADRIARSEA